MRGFTRALLKVVGFIMVGVGSLGWAYGSSGSFGVAWVHSNTPCVVGFIRVRVVHSGAPRGRGVHSGSRGFTWVRLPFVGFICVRVGSLRRAYDSSGSFRFPWVHSGAFRIRDVHLCSRVFTRALLGIVGFIRVRMG